MFNNCGEKTYENGNWQIKEHVPQFLQKLYMKLFFLSPLKGPRSCSQDQHPNGNQHLVEPAITLGKSILNADARHEVAVEGQQFSNSILRLFCSSQT